MRICTPPVTSFAMLFFFFFSFISSEQTPVCLCVSVFVLQSKHFPRDPRSRTEQDGASLIVIYNLQRLFGSPVN